MEKQVGTAYTEILYDQSGESLGENNRSTWTQRYVNFNGRHLGIYQNNATYATHANTLGSTAAVTDYTGAVVEDNSTRMGGDGAPLPDPIWGYLYNSIFGGSGPPPVMPLGQPCFVRLRLGAGVENRNLVDSCPASRWVRSYFNRLRASSLEINRASRFLFCLPLTAVVTIGTTAAPKPQMATPEVVKVEPPGWWVGHSINPVRVMVRGRNLAAARVEASGSGLTVSHLRVNFAGTYLFADVSISPTAQPGRRALKITTRGGEADAPFEVLPPVRQDFRLQGFTPDDVIYLLMPDRFSDGDPSNDDPTKSRGLFDRRKSRYYHGGDFQGIIDHLPYIRDLGVTAIWMTPIYDNSDRLATFNNEGFTDYHGYGATDFYAVEEHFGTMERLRALVDAAHRIGIKVIQDEVANHTGPDHPWVQDPPTPTWFHGTTANHINETWQTWTLMDPHATPAIQKPTLEGWFANILPDLNQNDEECERYLIQNTLWWIGMAGFDGIREDTLPYAPRHFWRDWMTAIKRQYPRLTVVGEMWDGDPALVSFFQGGVAQFDGIDTKVDSVFDFPLGFAIRKDFAEGKSIRDVAVILAHDYLYPNPQQLVTFLGNHDLARFMNESGATVAGLQLADTFLMTARGIPEIYYGDEIAMPGGNDPDNRRDFPGGWPGDPQNAFAASGRTPDQQAVFQHLRQLAHLRMELEPLRRGTMVNLEVSEQTYAYARVTLNQSIVVVINNGAASGNGRIGRR